MGASLDLNETLAHENAGAADPRAGHFVSALLGASDERARTAHLDALSDPPAKRAVTPVAEMREQTRERAGRASRGRVLRHAVQRREHARAELRRFGAPRVEIH